MQLASAEVPRVISLGANFSTPHLKLRVGYKTSSIKDLHNTISSIGISHRSRLAPSWNNGN